VQRTIWRAQTFQQFAALGPVVRLAWRQRERYGRARVRGDKVDLGVPAATGLADSLRTVFLSAGAVGMHLDAGAVQRHRFDLDLNDLRALQLLECAIKNT
jgi:hypothetical protein